MNYIYEFSALFAMCGLAYEIWKWNRWRWLIVYYLLFAITGLAILVQTFILLQAGTYIQPVHVLTG